MSLIADALNKAQQQQLAARSAVVYPPRRFRPAPVRFGRTPRVLAIAAAAALFGLAATVALVRSPALVSRITAAFYTPSSLPPPSTQPPQVTSLAAASPAFPTPRRPSATDATVFSPPPASVSPDPTPVPSRDYQLAGVTSLGKDTLLSISRRRDRRSLWIAVGKSAAEISVVSYQPESDRAVIRVHDRLLQIAMHDQVDDDDPSATNSPTATTE